MIDIRCRGIDPTLAHAGDAGRCQLAAGHEGPHALMFSDHGYRMVRNWATSRDTDVVDHLAGQEARPWVRGHPVPAWNVDGPGAATEVALAAAG